MENALKEIGRQILRLYRQFAGSARLMTLTGENKKTQVHYFNAADLDVNDVQFETENALAPEERKSVILKLYEAGLLTDENGRISNENKRRILDAFGFGSFENTQDISALHIAKAGEENLEMRQGEVGVDEYDDHGLHITEHTRYLLSAEFKKAKTRELLKARYTAHIQKHKIAMENNGKEKE